MHANCVAESSSLTISTAVLNWNRVELLERTLRSYSATVSVPYEIVIVDNGSSDDSRSVIQAFCSDHPAARAIFLDENVGGEALNRALATCRGEFFHISENDLEYLPGWADKVLDTFGAFPKLGQLSLFAPVPTDDEIWELHPSVLRHAAGRIIYETHGNVGASSVLRNEIWKRGVRVHSRQQRLAPDDRRLSADVRNLGYIVAWADNYLVRNLGHTFEEFTRRAEYYEENYSLKPWLGIAGWRRRMEAWSLRPRPNRSTFLPLRREILAEKTEPSEECPSPRLWSMVDGWTPEVETIEFLYGLVRAIKPSLVLETRSWRGHTAVAIGHALKANGVGRLVTLDSDPVAVSVARQNVEDADLSAIVTILTGSSLEYQPSERIELLLLDSDLGLREAEFRHFESNLGINATVVLHDTSAPDAVVRQGVARLDGEGLLKSVYLRTPRGLVLCQYTGRLGGQRIAVTPQTELDEYRGTIAQHEKEARRQLERRARELADKATETEVARGACDRLSADLPAPASTPWRQS